MVRKGLVQGMEIVRGNSPPTPCELCLKGKQTCMEIQKTTEIHASDVLERIHSNLCGKLPTRSHQGYDYFATFVDDKSQKVFVAGLRKKNEVLEHLHAFATCAHLETRKWIKILRSNGGGEYTGHLPKKYLNERGI